MNPPEFFDPPTMFLAGRPDPPEVMADSPPMQVSRPPAPLPARRLRPASRLVAAPAAPPKRTFRNAAAEDVVAAQRRAQAKNHNLRPPRPVIAL